MASFEGGRGSRASESTSSFVSAGITQDGKELTNSSEAGKKYIMTAPPKKVVTKASTVFSDLVAGLGGASSVSAS